MAEVRQVLLLFLQEMLVPGHGTKHEAYDLDRVCGKNQ